MAYFRNFPLTNYKFGDEVTTALFQNITAYVDLIDQVADNATYYTKYTVINGERPDTLSFKLYGTVDYYWTFYLLNENIRQQGWPIPDTEVVDIAKQQYPHTVAITSDSLHKEFYKGDLVATQPFSNPSFKAEIIEKRLDFGQLVLKPSKGVKSITITNAGSGYTTAPTVTITGDGEGATAQAVLDSDTVSSIVMLTNGDNYTYAPTVKLSAPQNDRGDLATATANLFDVSLRRNDLIFSYPNQPDITLWNTDDPELRSTVVDKTVAQHLSTHHYEDSNGEQVDIPISSLSGEGIDYDEITNGNFTETEITFLKELQTQNESLAQIKILKPEVVDQVVAEFQRLLRN